MKSIFLLIGLLTATATAWSQVDVGITGLKVLEPREYNDGDVFQDNDTIEKIEFYIHNYRNQPVENSDFGPQGVPIKMKYNNDSVLFYSMLVQPIQPGEAKKETMPEHHSSPHLFPDFPEDLDEDLIVCVETMYQGDADHSNDADCITIHHEEPADDNGDTTSVAERHQNSDDVYIRSAGNRLLISGFEQPENLKISIYTISGSLVTELRGTASELENSASTHKMKTGIYLVQLQSESGVMHTEKLFFK